MDPYEYLFSKLQLKFEKQPDFSRKWCTWIKPFRLYFNSKYICSFNNPHTIKDLFLCLTDSTVSVEEWTMKIRPIIKLLRHFPRDLESKEHVDLLLAINGMNIGA